MKKITLIIIILFILSTLSSCGKSGTEVFRSNEIGNYVNIGDGLFESTVKMYIKDFSIKLLDKKVIVEYTANGEKHKITGRFTEIEDLGERYFLVPEKIETDGSQFIGMYVSINPLLPPDIFDISDEVYEKTDDNNVQVYFKNKYGHYVVFYAGNELHSIENNELMSSVVIRKGDEEYTEENLEKTNLNLIKLGSVFFQPNRNSENPGTVSGTDTSDDFD